MDKIISLDYFLTNLFNKILPHNIFFDYFFSFFSMKGASILIWFSVIAIVGILEEIKNPGINRRDKKYIILFFISFLMTIIVSNYILKNIFHRPRPQSISNVCPLDFSFPSTHAATAFAAATTLTFFDKKRRWFYYTIAVLISYSRIYLSCHYFLDAVIGGMIGYLISKAVLSYKKI